MPFIEQILSCLSIFLISCDCEYNALTKYHKFEEDDHVGCTPHSNQAENDLDRENHPKIHSLKKMWLHFEI